MKPKASAPLAAAACPLAALLSAAIALTAQPPTQPPTVNVLYTFRTFGTPTAIVEVSPGRFQGLIVTPPGIFSITAAGKYQNLYTFPSDSSIGPIGLTPALNAQTYGSASNSGPITTFSELFWVAPDGEVTTHSYDGATQGGPNIPVQHPDGHLYSIFGIVGGSQTFSRMDYAGNFTPLYTFKIGRASCRERV